MTSEHTTETATLVAAIRAVLTVHVGTATLFCKACPTLVPERDENGELPDDAEWLAAHQDKFIAARVAEVAQKAHDAFCPQRQFCSAHHPEHLLALIDRNLWDAEGDRDD